MDASPHDCHEQSDSTAHYGIQYKDFAPPHLGGHHGRTPIIAEKMKKTVVIMTTFKLII
ncbi:MAG: hypothetical protein ACTSQG_09745 [Promethearchaeota archaeon]